MGNFGDRMQREREMRGITLEEIAEATKIGTRSLRALEAQEFSKLPGGIFNKGFVRAYAKYLGIDEEQAVADYSEALAEAQAAGLLGKMDIQDLNAELHSVAEEPEPPPSGSIAALALVVLILVAIGAGGWTYYSRYYIAKTKAAAPRPVASRPAVPSTPPPNTSPVTTPDLQNTAATSTSATAVPNTAAPKTTEPARLGANQPASQTNAAAAPADTATPAFSGFEFRVRAREDSWISLDVDGRHVMTGNLAASTEKSFRARQQVIMKTGNAGALEVSLNGKPQPSLGESNQVRTLTFTADGMRQ